MYVVQAVVVNGALPALVLSLSLSFVTLTVCKLDGAALFYASTKEDKNMSLLHKYLLHRAYGLPFKEAACVVDKDSIFMYVDISNSCKFMTL